MSTWTGPSQVMIVRHGEKLGDAGSDKDGGPDLSVRGSSRAAALPSLFVPVPSETSCRVAPPEVGDPPLPPFFTGTYIQVTLQGPQTQPRFPTPQFIFATAPGASHRPLETITPTARALGLSINAGFTNSPSDIQQMTTEILNNGIYSGKVVLICWHHGQIPTVAQDLGVPAKDVPGWKSTDFDRLWSITWDASGKPTLKDDVQELLFGDKTG
jgi:hypothetical protein